MNSATKFSDGSAGDANYEVIASEYAKYRKPDKRIELVIAEALFSATTVLNIGAGYGSYEPIDKIVTPVEPSSSMRKLRPKNLPTAIDAVAESLPFEDGNFDSSLATFTVHQWHDLKKGLVEMRRVTKDSIVILTCDPTLLDGFWLNRYAPEVIEVEARRYPSIEIITEYLGGVTEIIPVPIPLDCADGFQEAYYGRPDALLDANVRLSCSAWSFVSTSVIKRFEKELQTDLESGAWDKKYGHLRTQPTFSGSLRLLVNKKS